MKNESFHTPQFISEIDENMSFLRGKDVIYPEHSLLLHEIFEKQVEKTPNNVAVYFKGQQMTYKELNDRANRLATVLRQQYSVGPDDCVGIFMAKSIEYVISYLAILKAGGAYSPVDRSYPHHLIQVLLENAKLKLVICDTVINSKHLPVWQKRFCFDEDESIQILNDDSMHIEVCPREQLSFNNLAYSVFSGGSTGVPKSIVCPHMGAVQSYVWREKLFPFVESDRIACNVFFVWELLRPLLKGHPLYIIPDETIYDPQKLSDFIFDHKITRLLFTPSLLQAVLDMNTEEELRKKFDSIRLIWLCGEVVSMALNDQFKRIFPEKKLLNLYSVSECHDVTAADISDLQSDRDYASTGFVADNVQIYILDEDKNLIPKGQQGELYVGGVTLAREYFGLKQRTNERFVENPFLDKPIFPGWTDNRLYRTGDWARILPDNSLEIRGRCDSMVKIRGYSVELSTVEAILSKHPKVSSCVAGIEDKEFQKEDGTKKTDRILVAWIVPLEEEMTGGELRLYLKQELPLYMIPNVILRIKSLPIHPVSGKLEKCRLPSTDKYPELIMNLGAEVVPPRNETEQRLLELVRDVFPDYTGSISIHDEFDDIGGTSLKKALLFGLVQKEERWKDRDVVLTDIYDHPTIAKLAIVLTRTGKVENNINLHEEVKNAFPSSIQPKSEFDYSKKRDIKNILLTGSTGFLGAFLLKDLILYYPTAKIYCLVRGEMVRVIENMKFYDLWENHFIDRIKIVSGHLDRDQFGLPDAEYEQLAQRIDLIVHNGAAVNFTSSYEALKVPNVYGTRNIIEFAGFTDEPTPLYYTSTDGVYESKSETSDSLIQVHRERFIAENPSNLSTGYEQSKWVAEKVVHEAIERGFPAVIFRPGDICGHSKTGACNPNHDFVRLLQGVAKLKYAPNDIRIVDLTPVDYVSRAIVTHSLKDPKTSNHTFNLVHPEPVRVKDVLMFMRDILGYEDLQIIPPKEWLEVVKSTKDDSNPVIALWPFFEESMNRVDAYYESSKFKRGTLPDSYSVLRRMVHRMIQQGEIEKPVKYPLYGSSAIVTGCSSGIGKRVAMHLARNGVNVVVAARRRDRLELLKKRIESMSMGECVVQKADVTSREDCRAIAHACYDSYNSIDMLINCAGVMPSTWMKNAMQDAWDLTIDVNVKGVLNMIAAVLPTMVKNNHGDILNVTSDAGRDVFESLAVYSGTKFAVEAISKGTRKELVGKNIRVMSIQPGDVRTELMDPQNQPDKSDGVYSKDMLFDQILEPDDIARAVYFQLSQPRYVAVNEVLIEPTGMDLTPEQKKKVQALLDEKDHHERLIEKELKQLLPQ